MDEYTAFNLREGVFWIILAVILFISYKKVPADYKRISFVSAVIVLLFGISDFLEIEVGNFLEPSLWWLFVWKVLCIGGFAIIILWYFWLRICSDRGAKNHRRVGA